MHFLLKLLIQFLFPNFYFFYNHLSIGTIQSQELPQILGTNEPNEARANSPFPLPFPWRNLQNETSREVGTRV